MDCSGDEKGPATRTRAKQTFAPYNTTSDRYIGDYAAPTLVATGIDLSSLMRESEAAQHENLENDGEEADGEDITSLPNPASPARLPYFSPSTLIRSAYAALRRQLPTNRRYGKTARMTTGGRRPEVLNPVTAPRVVSRCAAANQSSVSLPSISLESSEASESDVDPPHSSISPHITRSISQLAANKRQATDSSETRRTRARIENATITHGGYESWPSTRLSHAAPESISAPTNASTWSDTDNESHVSGDTDDDQDTHIWTREELLAAGFRVVEWDGITPKVILDSEDRIVSVLAGRPKDADWDRVVLDALHAMDEVRQFAADNFETAGVNHSQGDSIALVAGVSYGGGQRIPGNFVQTATRRRMLNHLLSHPSFIRFASFHNSCLVRFAPKVYGEYVSELKPLWDNLPDLAHNFPDSVFPAALFNCGPKTVSFKHINSGNVAGGLSAITALGIFDPKVSALLVLFPLKMIIEFPSGSTVLLPSSVIHHANTALQPGDHRCSMTQYCAGALFKWVDYGFKSVRTLLSEERGEEKKKKIDDKKGERWKLSLDLLSKIEELADDRKDIFETPGAS